MNKIFLQGRLTCDPELKTTSNGVEYARFSIAVDRPKQKDKERESDFLPCTAWRKTAVFINRYFAKGDGILITGSMQMNKYQDKEGKDRTTYFVLIQDAEFPIGKPKEKDAGAGYAGSEAGYLDGDDDSDVPF